MTTAAIVEERAIKTLAQFRRGGVLARRGATSLDLVVVPGSAHIDDAGGCLVTFRLILAGEVARQVDEELLFVTGATMREPKVTRLFAYIDGWAQAIDAVFKRNPSPATMTPTDLVFPEALDTKAKGALAFAEKILIAVEERADAVQDALEEPEKPLSRGDLAATKPIAQDDVLEASIREAPEDREVYLVYADWLSERNDPRGELSICQANADRDPAARSRAQELLRLHRRYFLGAFGAEDAMVEPVDLTWRLGWVESMDFTTVDRDSLLGAMRLPSTKFLRSLRIRRLGYDDAEMSVMWSTLIEAGSRPTLRDLSLGREDDQISWMRTGAVPVTLPQLYPNLESLKLRAGGISLDAKSLALPKLKSLVVESGGLAPETTRAIVRACTSGSLPALTRLELWFGSRHYGGTTTIGDVLPLLATRMPKLTDLGLMNSEIADDIAKALKDAPLLRTVKNLDLSMGVLTGAGAASLAAAKSSLPLLETLNVSENYLSEDDIDRLDGLCAQIIRGEQKEWDPEVDDPEEDRYVSVSE